MREKFLHTSPFYPSFRFRSRKPTTLKTLICKGLKVVSAQGFEPWTY
jgi:hypothetical protein